MGDENNLEPRKGDPRRGGDPLPNPPPKGEGTRSLPEGEETREGSPSEGEGVRADASGEGPQSEAGDAGKGLTPGQRLAAKKALKARQKKDFKEDLKRKEEEREAREREEAERILRPGPPPGLPDGVQEVAGEFTGFIQRYRGALIALVLALVVGGLVVVFGRDALTADIAAQADALWKAIEIAQAPVDAEDSDGETDEGGPVFKTQEDRAKQAQAAFASVAKQDPDTRVAGWAKASQAAATLQLGQADEARALFASVYQEHGPNGSLALRALEGLAVSLEASGKQDEARKRFEQLADAEAGAAKDLAEYHLARLKLEAGDKEGAKTLLKGVYDRLLNAKPGAPRTPYLRGEVEARLAELDSSLVQAGAGAGTQFTPEQIQRLIEQLQQQQGAAPEGAGE